MIVDEVDERKKREGREKREEREEREGSLRKHDTDPCVTFLNE